MKFHLLGPFEITTEDGRAHTPPTPKAAQVLALLLTRPREIVPVDVFIQELWAEHPPRSALTTLQTYIYHSRKLLSADGGAGGDERMLVTRSPGYLIDPTGHGLDTREFEELVRSGRRAADRGHLDLAVRTLGEALDLWTGPALAGIATGRVLTGYTTYLEELRVRALESRVEALQLLGNERDLIPELRSLVQQYPLNEWFHARLIEALGHCGRRAEALTVYRDLWRSLADELGIEPSPEVQRLHHEVLNPVAHSGRAA